MVFQGEVYFPPDPLPPGQRVNHRVVVLTPDGLLSRPGHVFVNVAIIRSAVRTDGTRAPLVPGHSIPVGPGVCSFLVRDSIVETHQLFALALRDLTTLSRQGRLPPPILADVLAGARRLFS